MGIGMGMVWYGMDWNECAIEHTYAQLEAPTADSARLINDLNQPLEKNHPKLEKSPLIISQKNHSVEPKKKKYIKTKPCING